MAVQTRAGFLAGARDRVRDDGGSVRGDGQFAAKDGPPAVTSERARIGDSRIRELADNIVEVQARELPG